MLYVALWTQVVQSQPLLAMVRSAARVVARAQLEGILEEFAEGARSPGEVLAKRRVFAGRQFAEFERRVHMVVAGRDRYPDMVHRRARLVVECDGDAFHGSPAAVAADRERDADFLTIGYATLRFSFHDLLDRPERCRRTVLSVIADRLGAE